MSPDSLQPTFFQQVLKDSFLKYFLLLFIVVQIPYFFPGITLANVALYTWILSAVFLLPASVLLLWPYRRSSLPGNEQLFWKALSMAFFLWWLVSIITLIWWGRATATIDIVRDSHYVGYYVCWFIALNCAPQSQSHKDMVSSDRWLLGAAATVLSLCLFFYFILIPHQLATGQFDIWVPSLLFFTFLDLVLTLYLFKLMFAATTLRLKVLFGILAIVTISLAALDLLEALTSWKLFSWAQYAPIEILWSLPYLAVVLVARARNFDFPEPANNLAPDVRIEEPSFARTSPIVLGAFVLPVVHIGMDQFGFLQDELRQAQAATALGSLVLFWVLAVLENRSLRRVTEKAKAQSAEYEQLRIKQQVAEEAERVKRQFLANVSHELRTPMNGILGMSELLLLGQLDTGQRNQVEAVKLSGQGLLKIIDDILQYSKIDSGELSLVREQFNLKDVAVQVFDLFRATADSTHVQMNLELQDDVPLQIKGDPSRLRQVLLNLVGNAVKFTSSGEIRIRFSVAEMSDSTPGVLCEVIDNGIGIQPEVMDQLFTPFSQGDESSTRKFGGSGMGLAISKHLVEAQSGKIGVDSEPGKGSTFWFEIPYTVV